jgi:hypothetical protein
MLADAASVESPWNDHRSVFAMVRLGNLHRGGPQEAVGPPPLGRAVVALAVARVVSATPTSDVVDSQAAALLDDLIGQLVLPFQFKSGRSVRPRARIRGIGLAQTSTSRPLIFVAVEM